MRLMMTPVLAQQQIIFLMEIVSGSAESKERVEMGRERRRYKRPVPFFPTVPPNIINIFIDFFIHVCSCPCCYHVDVRLKTQVGVAETHLSSILLTTFV